MPRAGSKGYRKFDISSERYYELLHKARQYPQWKVLLDGLMCPTKAITYSDMPKSPMNQSDQTADIAIKCTELSEKIDKVEKSVTIATLNCKDAYRYLLANITLGTPPEILEAQWGLMPCGRNKFYDMRSHAFFIMHEEFD